MNALYGRTIRGVILAHNKEGDGLRWTVCRCYRLQKGANHEYVFSFCAIPHFLG